MQEQPRNRSAVFPINISHTTCIYTLYHHIEPLDSHFNPTMQGLAIAMICPDKVTSAMLFSNHFTSWSYNQPAVLCQDTSTYHHTMRSCCNDAHISWQSKSQCNQYLNSRFLQMAIFWQQLDYTPHAEIDRCAKSSHHTILQTHDQPEWNCSTCSAQQQ